MTGKLARLMVGSCMTAALTVSGLAGTMPAAHANPTVSCVQIGLVNINVVCTGNNSVKIPVEVTVKDVANGTDISVLETKIGDIIVGNHDTVVLAALNNIANDVSVIVKCNNVQVLSGIVQVNKTCS
jgi:hypothetical protein